MKLNLTKIIPGVRSWPLEIDQATQQLNAKVLQVLQSYSSQPNLLWSVPSIKKWSGLN